MNTQLKCLIKIKKLKLKIYEQYLIIALDAICKLKSIRHLQFRIAPYAYFPDYGFAYIYYDKGVLKKELPKEAIELGFGNKEKVTPAQAAKLIVSSHSKLEKDLQILTRKLLILAKTLKRREYAGNTSL